MSFISILLSLLIPKPVQPKRSYGLKFDLIDTRDSEYGALIQAGANLPMKIDLRGQMPAVFDQGQLGSCTANALLAEFQRQLRIKGDSSPLSRLMLYYDERDMEGTVSDDAGAQIRDGIKSLNKTGVATEATWPYDISNFATTPSDIAFKEASGRKISVYHRVVTLYELRHSLYEGFPVVIGFQVPESFESAQIANTGVMTMPKSDEKYIGGHAVLVVGYDDNLKVLIVRNSWGPYWGNRGYFTMPYAFFNTPNMVADMWSFRI